MNDLMKYADEADKSLGIAGMAISLVACDSEDYLASVSLEEGDEPLELAGEFFFGGNPGISAKIAWNEILRQYQVGSAMIMGNVLCRAHAAGHGLDDRVVDFIHRFICDEGHSMCSLDDDEVENLYNKNFAYYKRLFSHPSVVIIARDFADDLRQRRHMSAGEVLESLRRLNNL